MTPETAYDIVVVGGGLLGAGIARDAALRGLSVALLEKDDFGAGAAAQSSRLALGGLSALETLDFTRVRQDVREREILLQTAPDFVRPQSCLIPFYSPGLLAQTRLRASLALTDALGFDLTFDQAPRVHQLLSAADAQRRAPDLRPAGLTGAALVWEAAVPQVERLALALALDARAHGAALHTHRRVDDLVWESVPAGRARVGGVQWTDTLSGETGRTGAALTLWAAGTQVPQAGQETEPLRLLKVVSALGPPLGSTEDVLVFPREEESALLFAVPRPGGCWVGGLTTDGHGAAAYATGAEVAALVAALRAFLPGMDWTALESAQAAVFAASVPGQEVTELPGSPGLLCVSGSGVTSFRRIAEDAVDLACRKLGRWLSLPPCRTAFLPLPTPTRNHPETLRDAVARAVSEEEGRTLRDLLERRLPQLTTYAERRAALPVVLETMSGILAWDLPHQAAEIKAWEAERALTQAFRVL